MAGYDITVDTFGFFSELFDKARAVKNFALGFCQRFVLQAVSEFLEIKFHLMSLNVAASYQAASYI